MVVAARLYHFGEAFGVSFITHDWGITPFLRRRRNPLYPVHPRHPPIGYNNPHLRAANAVPQTGNPPAPRQTTAMTSPNHHSDDYRRQFMPPARRGPTSAAPPDASDLSDAPPLVTTAMPPMSAPPPLASEPQPPPSDNAPPTPDLALASALADADPDDAAAPAYVAASDLFKIYKPADLEVVALRGVDLAVAPGELVGIVGASGSGKTTLLNILAGLERPSAGGIRVGARDLLDISDSELVEYRRREVGFVWQATGRNLVPYLNVRDNIELPQAIAGVGKRQRQERAAELLDALQMSDKSRRYPAELSGGEQQRVAIAVALANRPPLLLADEPTGELDTNMAEDVLQMLRRINRRFGVTVIIVTHYAGIARWVDRVVRIRDGRIGSESYLTASYQGAAGQEQEYLVIDRAGRLQLPREYVDQLAMDGLASAGLAPDGNAITIRPAAAPPRSRTPHETPDRGADDF